jgi:hypothetical protein
VRGAGDEFAGDSVLANLPKNRCDGPGVTKSLVTAF